ncbi:DNA cytosine methyltransferase [Dokdonia sp.]|uniref:DNA cytosine methyltransferase n=1 Tax=Dokdonia sp. TaxID=2024995 RepID=UPI003267D024
MDSTKEHTNEQRILSFCYGYGGLEKGISSIIPTRTIAYVEIEAFQNFNLVSAMESGVVDKAPIWTNLKTFDPKPFHNKVHGIVGGYPCQGESLAGKRELWNDDRFLYPHIEQCIDAINPFWCFFENVAGHLSGTFPYVLASLQNLGYSVEAGLFTAEEVGAPHQRKRVFILAMDNTYIDELQAQRERRLGLDGNLLQNCRRKEDTIRFRETSKKLANSSSKRNGESSKEYATRKFIKVSNQWPAYPGQQQYEWEAKRAVEPGVDCTVNGYDFRTELLRQYGNGVVSQTASKAFSMLLDKHINNSKLQ